MKKGTEGEAEHLDRESSGCLSNESRRENVIGTAPLSRRQRDDEQYDPNTPRRSRPSRDFLVLLRTLERK